MPSESALARATRSARGSDRSGSAQQTRADALPPRPRSQAPFARPHPGARPGALVVVPQEVQRAMDDEARQLDARVDALLRSLFTAPGQGDDDLPKAETDRVVDRGRQWQRIAGGKG